MANMYYFRYHVKPANNHRDMLSPGSAVANVFVSVANPIVSKSQARAYLTGEDWEVVSLDQTSGIRDKKKFERDEMLVDLIDGLKITASLV